ncbi:MAG TPA: hypothetical protein VI792_07075 [Candidatus Eisenbacteria bacterium]
MTTLRRADRRPALAALVIGASALAAVTLAAAWPSRPSSGLWFWMLACALSEYLWVRLPVGRATLSMSSCFNLAALLVLPRGEAMLAVAVSVAVGEAGFMHKPAVRVAFNSAQTALAVAAGSLVFAALGGSPGGLDGTSGGLGAMVARLDLAPLAAAALAYSVVNTGAVSLAVSLSEGVSPWRAWRENFGNGFELTARGALLSLGVLVGIDYALAGPAGTLLAALPLVVAHQAYARRLGRLADERRDETERAA